MREITGGRGVDLVVDSVGGKILAGQRRVLAYRGRSSPSAAPAAAGSAIDARLAVESNQSLTGVFLGAAILVETHACTR